MNLQISLYIEENIEEKRHVFDPIVLAKNVTLTKEQKEVCRLPDCFAPTPREPIDVYDQALGTHQWAERLRWHRFFALQDKLQTPDDTSNDNQNEFEKKPWYQPTGKPAPKGDPALEAFINACSNQFIGKDKRRKIKDNLSKDQRKALKELKELPITHNAACRFADKSGTTVITSLESDDEKIKEALNDKEYYSIVQDNPTNGIIKKIATWADKEKGKGKLPEEIHEYIKDIATTHPGQCKPLIKTHKPQPYPMRLLLSGCGTPVEHLSKMVQMCIKHLPEHLPYQIMDTKEFLQKIEAINEKLSPLPESSVIASCDVVSLYPNVNNKMGIPAVKQMLEDHPSPEGISNSTILSALDLALNNNYSQYTDGQNQTLYAKPIRGTAMGPSHACDYVYVFMGKLDEQLVNDCPIDLITTDNADDRYLAWSRFRDDGFAILPNEESIDTFKDHLQSLHPPNIRWTVSTGKTAEYLDTRVQIKEGKLVTDVFSKHNHCYLPPNSCHPPSTFKGLIYGVGTRLRMICSEEETLQERIKEYSDFFELSGWDKQKARKELERGGTRNRQEILNKPRKKKTKKLAWVSTYDPRLPSKSKIIHDNLSILYSEPEI